MSSFSYINKFCLNVCAAHSAHCTLIAGVIADAAFPTPMDEPRKIMSCHFLGTLPVSMATGIVHYLLTPIFFLKFV